MPRRKAAPDRSRRDLAAPGEPICGAKLPGGGGDLCERRAGFGTDHLGLGNCYKHGGAMERGNKRVSKAELRMLAGDPLVAVHPGEALLWCVTLAAQDLAWINHMIMRLSKPTTRPRTTEKGYSAEKGRHESVKLDARQLDGYIQERFKAEERLARFAKMALDANVADRAVKLAEKMGEVIATSLTGILSDLNIEVDDKVAAVVERHLRSAEAVAGQPAGLLAGGLAG